MAGAFGFDPLTGAPRYQDDFYLNPAPGTGLANPNVMLPSMSLDQLYGQQAPATVTQQFTFPPLYPAGAGAAAGAAPDYDAAAPNGAAGLDYIMRYRAQADLLRRAGVPVPPPAGSLPANGGGVMPGLYADNTSTNPARFSLSTAAWPQHSSSQPDLQAYAQNADLGSRRHHYENGSTTSLAGSDSRHSLYSSTSSTSSRHQDHGSNSVSPVPPPQMGYANNQYAQQQAARPVSQQSAHPGSVASLLNNMSTHRDRRHSIATSHSGDYDSTYDYESTSSHGREGSVPSSSDHEYSNRAPSVNSHHSSAHHSHSSSISNSVDGERGQQHEGEGGFSSAFGMMSLDDPNVLAGLSNDAPPFFSGESMNGIINNSQGQGGENEPTPGASMKTPSTREVETRELRDFWKQYMRTPLSSTGGSGWTPIFGGDGGGLLGRPSPPKRGLSRVASLPSVKTPTGLGDVNRTLLQPLVVPGQDGEQGQTRTALHFADRDDLKSYEQAVLARKGLTNLNLVPKRARQQSGQQGPGGGQGQGLRLPPVGVVTGIAGNVSLVPNNMSGSSGGADVRNTQAPNAAGSRPGSAMSGGSGGSGGSSSLANALQDAGSRPGTAQSENDGHHGGRPSVKRLASQTLQPEYSKRPQLSRPTPPTFNAPPPLWGQGQRQDQENAVADGDGEDGDRRTVNISERMRRMSAPTVAGYP
ncbi:hypothetical protein GLOTRDRAFT_139382 [Gloeophyllum trabeum ATCC 11539]|uniref:Uncharacterized protein n=1 Tax=Gloeophyllum trabeum (strain ATCC 11539 / FP-39264 / Madison 617) TaxID=670483 RepID=S7Q2X4_GLOTA|nr:uncharacterized protein GLOTRDRAFT_139382 [Gloeophyllum trabeum ATCC 11539]EPQ53892.1 hypothetical protein GLOTRDRAFT_139382 [Gloeophyllum trabeum ATCC 11539]